MTGRPKQGDGKQETKRRETAVLLAKTAEAVMSREGVRHTPLRRIAQTARQKNESVMQYHFGTRENLIAAVLDLTTEEVDALRREMIAQFREATGGAPLSARQIVHAMIKPVTRILNARAGESHYVRFIGQISMDEEMWARFRHRLHGETMALCREAYAELVPHLPAELVHQRFGLALQTQCYGLCGLERTLESAAPRPEEVEARIAGIVDAVEAILMAPLSSETVVALTRAQRI
jgi:AcrR family transcriptional regulator